MVERPFIYVFDADALVAGSSPNDLSLQTQTDSDFLLRRLSGLNTVATKMQLRNDNRSQLFSTLSALPRDYPIAPELTYRAGSYISFDLNNISLASRSYGVGGSVDNFWSQLVFQGIRVFPMGAKLETSYRYYERFTQLTLDVTVDWSGRVSPAFVAAEPARRFQLEIKDYDFELFRVGLSEKRTGQPLQDSFTMVKFMLFDPSRNQLMNRPVADFFLSDIVRDFHSVFPVPPMLYPAGTQIMFEITSLLIPAQLPLTLTVTFMGIWRMPC